MNSLSELKVVNDDLEMRRYFLYCCFSYAGNWELVKLIVDTKLRRSHVCLHSQVGNRLWQLMDLF